MSLTRTLFDKNAYKARLMRSTDEGKYRVNEVYPSTPTCRVDHLNGFHGKHAAPNLVDHESDLYRLDDVLSDDPYYQFPKVNNSHKHASSEDCKSKFPSVQYSRLMYFYPTTELAYNRHDAQSVYMHPIHSSNYIGMNSREVGRFSNAYTPSF
jgi:hypothetical protein